MNHTIYTEDVELYGTKSSKQIPNQENYDMGVRVNWTAPAKWWNWLMAILTSNIDYFKRDHAKMRAEVEDVMSNANLVPADGTIRQLSNSIDYTAFKKVESVDVLPYVQDHKLILPVDEIL